MQWRLSVVMLAVISAIPFARPTPPAETVAVLHPSGQIRALEFDPEGRILLTSGCADPGCVRKASSGWELGEGQPRPWRGEPIDRSVQPRLPQLPPDLGVARILAIGPDEQRFAVGGEGPHLRLLDAATLDEIRVFSPPQEALDAFRKTVADEVAQSGGGHWHELLKPWVRSAAFSPDGEQVVAAVVMTLGMGLMGSQLWFWDVASEQALCEPILCRFSSGRVAAVEALAVAIHPTQPLLAVSLSTPGETPQSRIGEIQLLRLPECLPYAR